MELLSQCRELVPNAKSEIWHRSTYLLRLPVFLVLELPLQCMELVQKAKNQIWNHFWLHVVDALSKFLVFFMVDVKKVFFMVDVKKTSFFHGRCKKREKTCLIKSLMVSTIFLRSNSFLHSPNYYSIFPLKYFMCIKQAKKYTCIFRFILS